MKTQPKLVVVSKGGARQGAQKPTKPGLDELDKRGGAKPRRKRAVKRTALLIFLGIAGVLMLGVTVLYKIYVHPPKITPVPTPSKAEQSAGPGQSPAITDPGEQTDPAASGFTRKDGFYTVLLVGLDKVGMNTDVIMVASFDDKNKKVDVINIPRDTLVDADRDIKKINGAYGQGGLAQLKREVESVVGFVPDMYALVDIRGFVRLVDTVDGVDFDVPVNMDYDDDEQDLHIHFKKGPRHLDGQEALEVVRFRQNNAGSAYGPGYLNGDLGRIQTTQALLKAFIKKLLRPSTLGLVSDQADIIMDSLDTDLKIGEMLWFVQQSLSVDTGEDLNFYTLSTDSGMYQHHSYVFVDERDALELINATVNPYEQDITELHLPEMD